MGLLDRFRGKPTLDSFARDLMAGIRKAGHPDELRYEPSEKVIHRFRDGEVYGQIGLANMFQAYSEAPKGERARLMGVFVRSALSADRKLPDDYESAKADLRPRLWNRASIEMLRAQGSGPDLVTIPVGGHILASVVYDWPETVQSITPSQIEAWGVTPYQALEDAIVNLSEATEGFAAIGDNLCTFISGDSYDASRMLLPDWLERMELKGRKVAIAPNRDAVLFTGEDDEKGLAMMAGMAEEAVDAPYPLAAAPMVWEDGEWRDWMPPEGHPSRPAFEQMRSNWLGPIYAQQKEMLEAKFEKEGSDVFVATFSGSRRPDGTLVSHAVWGEGVETLLPEAEKITIVREAGIVAIGTFSKVMEVAGDLLVDEGVYPPRWRTRAFPSQEQIERIGMGEM